MLIYGVGNHTPEQFITWLKAEYQVSDKAITIHYRFQRSLKKVKLTLTLFFLLVTLIL